MVDEKKRADALTEGFIPVDDAVLDTRTHDSRVTVNHSQVRHRQVA
ncbi:MULTISPECIES: hypothetical protein [unclassified Streptomyces]|nr:MULTISPECIES: hypothetical protein [unclassified Streptomyces]MYS22481.1 hypothetical protein [Streptomyces sp. SID4948]